MAGLSSNKFFIASIIFVSTCTLIFHYRYYQQNSRTIQIQTVPCPQEPAVIPTNDTPAAPASLAESSGLVVTASKAPAAQARTSISAPGGYGSVQHDLRGAFDKWGPKLGERMYEQCKEQVAKFETKLESLASESGSATGLYSQCNEDWYLLRFLLTVSPNVQPGTFMDLAANHYMKSSNTYFMEQCLGWNGVCMEANPTLHKDLRRYRSCKLFDRCVYDEPHIIKFLLAGGSSGIVSDDNYRGLGRYKDSPTIEIKCATVEEALQEIGESTRHFDFLSLDIEGVELQAMKGVDWKTTVFSVILVEDAKPELITFLESKGYIKDNAMVSGSSLFFHQSFKEDPARKAIREKWTCTCAGCKYSELPAGSK